MNLNERTWPWGRRRGSGLFLLAMVALVGLPVTATSYGFVETSAGLNCPPSEVQETEVDAVIHTWHKQLLTLLTPVETHQHGFQQGRYKCQAKDTTKKSSTTKLRVLGIDRGSTKRQVGEEKAMRAAYKRAFDRFIADNEFISVGYRVFAESGKSGTRRLDLVSELLDQDKIDAVWFPQVDRSFRDDELGLRSLREWTERGLRIYYGSQLYEPDDPGSHTATSLNLTIATNERRRLQGRALAQHHYAAKGEWLANGAPFGYVKDEETRLLSFHPVESDFVRRAFEAAAAQELAACKITEARKVLELPRHRVRKILQNPLYRGELPWGKERYPIPDYRLVSDEVWSAAQRPRKKPKTATQTALERMGTKLGNAVTIKEFVQRIPVPCPSCPPPESCSPCKNLVSSKRPTGRPPTDHPHRLRFAGVERVGSYEVPLLGCRHGHTRQIVAVTDIEACQVRLKCRVCGEKRSSKFWARPLPKTNRWQLQCKICCAKQGTYHYHPFTEGPLQQPASQTTLTDRDRSVAR